MKSFIMIGLALLAGGCVDSRTLVLVQEDGSGTITINTSVRRSGLDQMGKALDLLTGLGLVDAAKLEAELGLPSGKLTSENFPQIFDEDELRLWADGFGDGVRLVRNRATSEADNVGFVALYAFDDINALHLGMGRAPTPDTQVWNYRFVLERGSKLTLAPPSPSSYAALNKSPSVLDDVIRGLQSAPGMSLLLGPALRDARVQIQLQTAGSVRDTTAEYQLGGPTGNTFVLADADASEMPTGAELLRLLNVRTPDQLAALHQERIPGLRLQDPLTPMVVSFE